MKKIILVLFMFLLRLVATSQVLMTGAGSYSENFNSLNSSAGPFPWADNSTISNVYSQRSVTGTFNYLIGTGSVNTGGLYSFGATSNSDRALGTVGSAGVGNLAHGLLLKNSSGFTVNSLNVSYKMEQWRNGGKATPDTLTFWYKISPNTISSLTPGSNTGWISVTALNAVSPTYTLTAAPLDGNNTLNQVVLSAVSIPNLVLQDGYYIMLKWDDINHPGNDHGLAIDDITVDWTPCTSPTSYYQDSDGDSFGNSIVNIPSCIAISGYVTNNSDCDDNNAAVNPNTVWYADNDGDGFGNVNATQNSCTQPQGYVSNSTDCNDNDANNNALATYYQDADGDGFGNLSAPISNCGQPSGYVTNSTDCDDNNSSANIVTTWYQDNDNDGFGSGVSTQNCGQPIGYVSQTGDCDDNNNAINPGATEVYDQADNNCNGSTDEGFTLQTWYLDGDGDGFGGSTSTQDVASPGSNYSLTGGDCDDAQASINPNAQEVCDGIDNNCDGQIDNGFTFLTYYADADQDGFGNVNISQSACSQPSGYVTDSSDCDDSNAAINPSASEICDGLDNNCDGQIDNGLSFSTYYADADQDGYGNLAISQIACSQPNGYVPDSTDCDDNNASLNPGATDIPLNGIDEDCSGSDAPLVPVSLGIYQFIGTIDCNTQDNLATNTNTDLTFSNFNGVGTNCATGGGIFNRSGWNTGATVNISQYNEFSINTATCKTMKLDRVAFKFRPSASAGSPVWHLRSSLDNYSTDIDFGTGVNVNNAYLFDTVYLTNHTNLSQVTFRFYITEMLGSTTTWRMDDVSVFGNIISLTPQLYYADGDGDGYGNPLVDSLSCSVPQNFVLDNTDCDDANNLINPLTVWYFDNDGDQIGDSSQTFIGCSSPVGYVLDAGDCDDNNTQISAPVTYYLDNDGDTFGQNSSAQTFCQNPGVGYVTVGGDCNDLDPLINPNATEICDGIDNDCDGLADEGLVLAMYYVDADGDGFGDEATGVESCSQPQNTITVGGDCDDANDQIYPGATEICDAVDNDCDGSTDEGLTFLTYYTDADNDGFGIGSTGLSFCENPGLGFSTNNQDCDDTNGQINPNATDILDNGIDENCDGVDGYLGIQVLSDINFVVSPNPNSGSFTINFNQLVSNSEINLTDLNGKVVRIYQLSGDTIQISDSNLEKGVYLLKVSIQGNTLIERIIVQ